MPIFIIFSTKGYDLIESKLAYYGLSHGEPRKNFDLEGFISQAKQSQRLSSYEHVPLEQDDLVRNLDESLALEKLEAYDEITKCTEGWGNKSFVFF